MHFGATLRLLRVDAGISLRVLAARIGVSSAYLSRVEHGHDPAPTPDRLAAIAQVLDIPVATILELAQQTGAAVSGYISRVPAAGALFLDIARRDLQASQLARIKAFIEQEFPQQSRKRPSPVRLSQMLSSDHVIVQMSCADIDDVVSVAVSRMALGRRLKPRSVVAEILKREHDASSALGSGVLVPHASLRGSTTEIVLVTLAQPLAIPTPDQAPVRVVVVLVSGESGRRQLEILAHIARCARHGLVDELCHAHSPARLLTKLAAIESMW